VVSLTANIVLGVLVVILGLLLIARHRQLKRINPMSNLEQVLANLQANLVTNRAEGKIQKVAGQLSDILINNLQSDRILFFRRQRRFMEMNYVYGLRNIRRPQYRIKLSNGLAKKLTAENPIHHADEFENLVGEELQRLLTREQFNIVFPIFWLDNLFGVYFIRTRLPIDHPLIKTFFLYLNQNLSAAYQIKRLESTRQALEQKVEDDRRIIERLEENREPIVETDENPGHLIEMFNHRKIEDLMAGLFSKVKAGLKADRLAFYSPPPCEGHDDLKFALGFDRDEFDLNGAEFFRIFGELRRHNVNNIERLPELLGTDVLKEDMNRIKLDNVSRFSLAEGKPGLLFWSGRGGNIEAGRRLLDRLEKIGQRALKNAVEFERLEEKSYTDSLTGLYNHRYFVKRLNEEIQRASRYRRNLGLMLFDIDDFKLYNDRFGHQWGDELLRRMGSTLTRYLRSIDIVSRYGGDEFCIIMPEADRTTCSIFMERLRHAIAVTDFRDRANGFEGKITISIGSSVFPDDADSTEKLIYCADMALLRSKALGRNRSTCFATEILEEQ
jgi:diguanylate cyclase (GGDEF)-like protein